MTEGDPPDSDPDPNLREAVGRFLDGAEAVYGDYEQGYMDADSALTVLERHVTELRAVAADGADGAEDGVDEAAEVEGEADEADEAAKGPETTNG